jgi:hypothetical protein
MLINLFRSLRNTRYKARKTKPSRSALGRRKLLPKNVLQRKVNVLSSPRFTDLTDYLATRNKKPVQEEDESE